MQCQEGGVSSTSVLLPVKGYDYLVKIILWAAGKWTFWAEDQVGMLIWQVMGLAGLGLSCQVVGISCEGR